MAYDPLTLALVALGIVIGAAGILYFVTRRVRKRAQELHTDLAPSTRYQDDQAYNQIQMGRAELVILQRQGYDVSGPSSKLSEANERLGRHDYDSAIALAAEAHEAMVGVRSGAPATLATGPKTSSNGPIAHGPVSNGPVAKGAASAEAGAAERATAPPVAQLQKNQAESRFQITLLVEDLARSRSAHPQDPATNLAQKGLSDAQLAFTKGEYTEALRIALRTRRTLGSPVEGLPPPLRNAPMAGEAAAGAETLTGEAKAISCPRCGRPVRSNDKFCRACGAPRSASACPRCGASIAADDVYCGACGAPMS